MNTYQLQALQTRAGTETPYEDAQHAGYGLMTEVGEILDNYKRNPFYKTPIDTKNLVEEVGDVLWYISIGYHSIGKVMSDIPPPVGGKPAEEIKLDRDKLLAKIAHHAANFFSIVMMYPDSWKDEQLDYDLDRIYSYLACFSRRELDVDIKEAATANLEKIGKEISR